MVASKNVVQSVVGLVNSMELTWLPPLVADMTCRLAATWTSSVPSVIGRADRRAVGGFELGGDHAVGGWVLVADGPRASLGT